MLALRYLKGRLQRSILTTLAVALGVCILFGMNGVIPPMMDAFRRSMYTSANQVDFSISSVSNTAFDEAALQIVKTEPGVGLAEGYLSQTMLLPISLGGATDAYNGVSALDLTGVDPAGIQALHIFTLASGRFLNIDDTDAVVLSQYLASTLNKVVGDTLKVPAANGTTELEIVGILNNVEPNAQTQIYTPVKTAQQILNLKGQINSIDVLLKADADKQTVQKMLLDKLGGNFKVGTTETGTSLYAALTLGQSVMWFFGIAALLMAGFIIFNTFRTLVAERRRDLAMLRAIGARRQTLVGMILIESMLQGAIGTAFGLLCGWLLANGLLIGLRGLIQGLLHMQIGNPVFNATNWIASIVLGVGFTIASAYFPARTAMQITPMEALRPALGSTEYRKDRNRAFIGGGLLVLALFGLLVGGMIVTSLAVLAFVIGLILVTPALVRPVATAFGWLFHFLFPREGELAQQNLARQPGRAATTASAMMIGLALTVAMLGMITSLANGFMTYLDKSLGSDFILMPTSLVLGGGNIGAAPTLAEEIARVPGVSGVTTIRLANSQIKGNDLQILGIDPVSYPQISGLEFSKGDPDGAFKALAEGRGIIVNGIFATTANVKVGDTLTLKTPQGDKEYQVAGIGMDYLNAKLATAYISQKNLALDFNQTSDVLLMVDAEKTASVAELNASLQSVANQYPAFSLYDASTFKKSQQQLFSTAISAIYLLVLILAIPGLIAMVNTMSVNVIERTREIGMLRAVGSTRAQIRRIILAESLLLSSLGSVTGIAVGLYLSSFIIKALNFNGFKLGFYFPVSGIVFAIFVSLMFGVLASLAPARKAANTEIVEALRYE
jgi:putative ABC transport system permease protein